jgi:hypothetical protein
LVADRRNCNREEECCTSQQRRVIKGYGEEDEGISLRRRLRLCKRFIDKRVAHRIMENVMDNS